jgi:hypothetical protein
MVIVICCFRWHFIGSILAFATQRRAGGRGIHLLGVSNKTIDEAKLAIANMEGDIFWFFLALKMQ